MDTCSTFCRILPENEKYTATDTAPKAANMKNPSATVEANSSKRNGKEPPPCTNLTKTNGQGEDRQQTSLRSRKHSEAGEVFKLGGKAGGGEKMQLDPSENAMQKNAKKCKKMQKKKKKKCKIQRNSLINPHLASKKASGAVGAGMKMSKKMQLPTLWLTLSFAEVASTCKKVQLKNATFSQNRKCKKKNAKNASCIFSPPLGKGQKPSGQAVPSCFKS
jgi:hypothetical protein